MSRLLEARIASNASGCECFTRSLNGFSLKEVAEIFCVDEGTVRAWRDKWEEERAVKDAPRSGRPPALGEAGESELKRLVEENNRKTFLVSYK